MNEERRRRIETDRNIEESVKAFTEHIKNQIRTALSINSRARTRTNYQLHTTIMRSSHTRRGQPAGRPCNQHMIM